MNKEILISLGEELIVKYPRVEQLVNLYIGYMTEGFNTSHGCLSEEGFFKDLVRIEAREFNRLT